MVEHKCPKGDSWNEAREDDGDGEIQFDGMGFIHAMQKMFDFPEDKDDDSDDDIDEYDWQDDDDDIDDLRPSKTVGGNSIAVFTIGFDIHHLQLDDQRSTVRKGKSSDLLFTDEEEQMKRNRRRTDEAAPTEQMKNRKKYEEQVKNADEKINRSKEGPPKSTQ
ncbi:hypothetical protein LOTGIDRAFT_175502 [Lottia gigantea]|uniref:Uncharacterized protein n=1 Tax=Lottia gigantea TaxID=225164 RepID=V3ZRQ8_LOTGI|nr:hypothetical protein LOTGIDRAFT_175502 [Lottia gigantea]ESO94108.1 hypothetical protein LOTGIDRAFT_175502 [Lottia gigantea]